MSKSMKRFLAILVLGISALALSPNSVAQTKTISGTITDASGLPIPGATVMVQGTTIGAAADLNGRYTLSANKGAIIDVISLGFITRSFTVDDNNVYDITLMEDTEVLENAVVVGYGVAKKETLSGAVSAISADDIKTTKTDNLINNIQGKVPGLMIRQQSGEPGEFNNLISIRGFGTPLFIIDGVQRGDASELATLNSEDIESISVLKDASAAIYGMGAANGVVIVTTKKGQEGTVHVNYTGMATFKNPTAKESTIDAASFYKIDNELQLNDGAIPKHSQEKINHYLNGDEGYQDFDWVNILTKKLTFSQSHNVSVSGGSKNVKYFASLGYNDDDGLLKSNAINYNRINFRATITANLTENLSLNATTSGVFENRQQTRMEWIWIMKRMYVADRGVGWHTMANPNHLTNIPQSETENPYALASREIDGYRDNLGRRYSSTLDLTYKVPFVKGLSLLGTIAFDTGRNNAMELDRKYDLYDYYTDVKTATYGEDKYTSTISLNERLYGRAQVNYNRTFNDAHDVAVTLVSEFSNYRTDYLEGARKYPDLFTNDILSQGSPSTATNEGNREFSRSAAFLGRINYAYKGKYLFEGVGRYDGSSRYAPGHRWAFFPSVSAGWRISEEPFIKNNVNWINNLKLRASYGEIGSNVGMAFAYVPGYTNSGLYSFNGANVTTGMANTQIVSDKLTWVVSQSLDAGIDWDFWKGKFGGSVDYFQRKNIGTLASKQQSIPDDLLGATFTQENLNSNMDYGVEIMLSHRNRVSSDFNYSITANLTYSRTKNLYVEGDDTNLKTSWQRYQRMRSGRLTGWMALYDLEDGCYSSFDEIADAPLMSTSQANSKMLPGAWIIKDLNGNGRIDSYDQTYDHWGTEMERPKNPPLQYGVTFSMNYKQFDLTMLLQGAAGHAIQWKTDDVWGYGRFPATYAKYLDRWHPAVEGADPFDPATEWVPGYWPALRGIMNNWMKVSPEFQSTERSYVPAAYLRLKSMEIGYTLPSSVSSKLKITNARVFFSAYNLFTICNKLLKGADPERVEGAYNAGLTYPLMRSFNFGLNINF